MKKISGCGSSTTSATTGNEDDGDTGKYGYVMLRVEVVGLNWTGVTGVQVDANALLTNKRTTRRMNIGKL